MKSLKNILRELHATIAKMSLEACCLIVIPDFGVRWRQVSQAVRNSRLPMTSASVAQVLCRHVAKSVPEEELQDLLARLRLKLVATQSRNWHVFNLFEPTNEPITETLTMLPHRVLQALRNGKNRNRRPEVQSTTLNDLMYLSVQFVSENKESPILYMCTPPGEPVALFSSVTTNALLKACVEGLGYKRYENAQLSGKDIPSLLRISSQVWTANAEHLSSLPEYRPTPTILPNGVDYTNRQYDEDYVDNLIGPDPPLLTDLSIKSTRSFFDKTRLDKSIKLSVTLKSDDVAKTLKTWVTKGALAPTSDFFHLFHEIKSNRIQYNRDSD